MVKRLPARGTLAPVRFESAVLKGNPLGDPHVREIPIYLPPSYFSNPSRRYPVIYFLTGFTGKGTMLLNDSIWVERLDARIERLIKSRKTAEAIVVMPDCSTRYGGSQYLDSIANGRYETHVVRELVRYVDTNYRTLRHPGARAIVGKSSGGYGALALGMRHPDVFGLVACHSGDMYFELCYKPDLIKAMRDAEKFGGFEGFFRRFPKVSHRSLGPHHALLNSVAMAMAYSPRKRRAKPFEMPFDERTGEWNDAVWREWLRWDPVWVAKRYRSNLKKLKLLFIDCGTKDEYQLQFGARILSARLKKLGVRHIHEEFDAGHSNIQYRYDRSLELIGKAWK